MAKIITDWTGPEDKASDRFCQVTVFTSSEEKLSAIGKASYGRRVCNDSLSYADEWSCRPLGSAEGISTDRTSCAGIIYGTWSAFLYRSAASQLAVLSGGVFLARYTDRLIVINHEDYDRAQSFPVRGCVVYVPGVGVPLPEETAPNARVMRETTPKMLLSVGSCPHVKIISL